MSKIAITGTIGSGKSTIYRYLKSKGFHTFSCDEENNRLLKKGNIGYLKVKDAFPECFIDDNLDKSILADIIFNNKEKKELLESILHPLILDKILKNNNDPLFIEIALLFEVNWDKYVDYNLLVLCDKEILIKRLIKRGLDIDDINQRINNQIPQEEKIKRADKIIYNNGSLNDLYIKVDKWLDEIL